MPNEYREKAPANMREEMADTALADMKAALLCAFNWAATPEGEEFWSDVYENVVHGPDKLNALLALIPSEGPCDVCALQTLANSYRST